jgi:hypothetical protein
MVLRFILELLAVFRPAWRRLVGLAYIAVYAAILNVKISR